MYLFQSAKAFRTNKKDPMLIKLAIVALGVVLILALLSLLASTLMNWVSHLFGFREKNLEKALKNMLATSDVHASVYQQFVENPVFRQLSERPADPKSAPTSLNKEDFTSILMNVITRGNPVQTSDELSLYIEQLPDVDLKNALRQFLADANYDLNAFRFRVGQWYENVIEHADRWYQKRIQKGILFIGFLMALGFNIDAFQLFNALKSNPEALQRVLSMTQKAPATNYTPPANAAPSPQPYTPPAGEGMQPYTPVPAPPPSAPAPTSIESLTETVLPDGKPLLDPTDSVRIERLRKMVNRELDEAVSPLGIGWEAARPEQFSSIEGWLSKLLGWGVTAFAISFGAPFLFEILQKATNRRGPS